MVLRLNFEREERTSRGKGTESTVKSVARRRRTNTFRPIERTQSDPGTHNDPNSNKLNSNSN
jgi:hypothetical protein